MLSHIICIPHWNHSWHNYLSSIICTRIETVTLEQEEGEHESETVGDDCTAENQGRHLCIFYLYFGSMNYMCLDCAWVTICINVCLEHIRSITNHMHNNETISQLAWVTPCLDQIRCKSMECDRRFRCTCHFRPFAHSRLCLCERLRMN